MYYTQCLLPVILPIIFWAVYHFHKDRHLPEPTGHLLLALALGAGSFYIGLGLYSALGVLGLRQDAFYLAETSLPGLFAYSILAIGPIEEFAKFIPFWLVILRLKEFDEPLDGIIYASFIALGFGAVENFYHLRFLSGIEAWGRAFVGPVLHIVFASLWGYFIGRAWLCQRSVLKTGLVALTAAALVHGIYDFFVIGFAPEALPIAALIVIAVWIWRLREIRYLHTLPPGPCPDNQQSGG